MRINRRFGWTLLLSLAACGGSETTTPKSPSPTQWSGAYELTSYNGTAIPASLGANATIQSGTATLWPSGYYEILVTQASASGSRANLIFDLGDWASSNSQLQLSGTQFQTLVSQRDGGFTVREGPTGNSLLEFRRTADAPSEPTRQFTETIRPTYSGALTTTGDGANRAFVASLVIKNPDVIARTTSLEQCAPSLWLTTDSTDINTSVYNNDGSVPYCDEITDTIPPKGTKSHSVSVRVSDIHPNPVTAGNATRFYAWVRMFAYPTGEARVGLGWITLTP